MLTGLILFPGIGLLMMRAIESRRRTPWSDGLIVLAILGSAAGFGLVSGVIRGLVTVGVRSVFTLSKSTTIRRGFSLLDRRSKVARPGEIRREHGYPMRGLARQGVLSCGTTSRLPDEVRAALAQTGFVVLDFRLVLGGDGSSTAAIRKLRTLCADAKSWILRGVGRAGVSR